MAETSTEHAETYFEKVFIKMKILIIPSWYPTKDNRASGIFFLKQAQLLAQMHEVRVLIGKERWTGYRGLVKVIKEMFSLTCKRIDYFLDELPTVKVHQFEFVNFSFNSERKKKQRLILAYQKYFAIEILGRWTPDLIHAHDVINAGIVSLSLKQKFQLPFVITSHTPHVFTSELYTRKEEIINVFRNAESVLAVSEFDKRNLISLFGGNLSPIVVGNYIDEHLFTPKEKKEDRDINFLYAASPSSRKDFPTLFSALKLIGATSNFSFLLTLALIDAQDDISIGEIHDMIKTYQLEGKVVIHINKTIENGLLELYHKCSLYLSSGYYETFGVAVAEALCCEIPVVAIDSGGVRDIIEHGVNGWLVPIKNDKKLAEYIIKFMEGQLVYDSTALRDSIVRKFGSRAYLEKLNKCYKAALDDQRN